MYGAEKAARWFGKILSEQCGVTDRRNDSAVNGTWAEICNTYYERKKAMEAQNS